jgi:hypothetical protein
MSIYKIIFAKNEVISCKAIEEEVVLDGTYHYEQIKGCLIYALVKANTEKEAYVIANVIIEEVKTNVFGNDFVY